MRCKAYVLIQAEAGSAEPIASALRTKRGVMAADVVTGPHDVIAVIQGQDPNDVASIIVNEIQTTKGVSRTTTYVVPMDAGITMGPGV